MQLGRHGPTDHPCLAARSWESLPTMPAETRTCQGNGNGCCSQLIKD